MDLYGWLLVVTIVVSVAAVVTGWLSWRERHKRWKEHLVWRDERIALLEGCLAAEKNHHADVDDLYAALEILYSSDPMGPHVTRWIEGLP